MRNWIVACPDTTTRLVFLNSNLYLFFRLRLPLLYPLFFSSYFLSLSIFFCFFLFILLHSPHSYCFLLPFSFVILVYFFFFLSMFWFVPPRFQLRPLSPFLYCYLNLNVSDLNFFLTCFHRKRPRRGMKIEKKDVEKRQIDRLKTRKKKRRSKERASSDN